MSQHHLTRADLAGTFTPTGCERVGLELELGLVDPATGQAVPYPRSRAVLEALAEHHGGTRRFDGPHLTGVSLPDDASFSLEMGGSLEYSSAPHDRVTELTVAARRHLITAAALADERGVAVLAGGLLPFTPPGEIQWVPKPRVGIMREFFDALGERGVFGPRVMGLTLAEQVHVDYLDETDLGEKLRLLVAASPIIAALLVNSPIASGRPTGLLSTRMRLWEKVDHARCGVLPFVEDTNTTVADLIDWALTVPMIYRAHGDGHVAAPRDCFARLIDQGFGDGTWPGVADWHSHLDQTWPHVRVRATLETRAGDAPPWPHFPAVAAVWTGLVYGRRARSEALALLADLTVADLRRVTHDIAVKGLHASISGCLVGELAGELLRLARLGLAEQVAEGREGMEAPGWLDVLDEIVQTGVTFADRCLELWHRDRVGCPARYVAAFRIPPE